MTLATRGASSLLFRSSLPFFESSADRSFVSAGSLTCITTGAVLLSSTALLISSLFMETRMGFRGSISFPSASRKLISTAWKPRVLLLIFSSLATASSTAAETLSICSSDTVPSTILVPAGNVSSSASTWTVMVVSSSSVSRVSELKLPLVTVMESSKTAAGIATAVLLSNVFSVSLLGSSSAVIASSLSAESLSALLSAEVLTVSSSTDASVSSKKFSANISFVLISSIASILFSLSSSTFFTKTISASFLFAVAVLTVFEDFLTSRVSLLSSSALLSESCSALVPEIVLSELMSVSAGSTGVSAILLAFSTEGPVFFSFSDSVSSTCSSACASLSVSTHLTWLILKSRVSHPSTPSPVLVC